MENDTYAVIEIQSNGDSLAVLSSTYKDWNSALRVPFPNTQL